MATTSKESRFRGTSHEISYNHAHGDPDLEVKVQDSVFHVHKTVLMETSDYFRAMLKSGMRESRENSVQLQGFTTEAFQIVLDFLYESNPINLSDKLHCVLEMVQFLQMRPVLDYIKSKLSCENCVHLYMLADTYAISDLREAAAQLMGDNYLDFLRSEVFEALRSDQREEIRKTRFRHQKFLCGVNTGYITWPEPGPREFMYYNHRKDAWETFTEKPEQACARGWGVAALDNYIYVIGGYGKPRFGHPSGIAVRDVLSESFCYDPVKNKWFQIRSLGEARAYAGTVVHDRSVYAIGGFQYDYTVKTTERYIPEQDRWEFRRPLPGDWTNYDLAVVCKGDIYINSEEEGTGTFALLKYTSNINQWEVLSPLPRKRDKHSMVAVGETIYLLGGLAPGVDCFNVTTKQWSALAAHPATEAIEFEKGCTEMDGTIYVLNSDDLSCYSLEAQTWVQGLSAFPAVQEDGPTVQTQFGAVQGMSVEEGAIFLGLPFAVPPVGQLRWKPPQPYTASWAPSVRDGTQPGPACRQPGCNPTSPDVQHTCNRDANRTQSEDCLYLNIFSPNGALNSTAKPLPVLLWIHGGNYRVGTGSAMVYDGRFLANKTQTVVVTINYRLGAFGFLVTGEGEDDAKGNVGLLDQVEALKWVQKNIGSFGGDKDKVTIFGQSAGSDSVATHLISNRTAHLFARAITVEPQVTVERVIL
ncbi:protein polyubiquitination [Branchiostoma belcheri]|nr:protein polyubiquitination [Branchiostoma belcheri]